MHSQHLTQSDLILKDFGEQYSLDYRVLRYLLERDGIDSLQRFRCAYSEEYDYKALVTRAGFWCNLGENPHATAQAADLKRAWTEVTSCYRRRNSQGRRASA